MLNINNILVNMTVFGTLLLVFAFYWDFGLNFVIAG